MVNSRRSKFIGTFALCSLALAACDGGMAADASDVTDASSDVGQDVATDTGPTDTGPDDVQDDVQADAPSDDVVADAGDAGDDASGDAGTCPSTMTYPEEFYVDPTNRGAQIEITRDDTTQIGGAPYNDVRARIWNVRDTPTMTIGSCHVYTTINPARAANYSDVGAMTVMHNGMSGMLTYDTGMHTYTTTDFSTFSFTGGMNVNLTIPAGTAGPAGMVDLVMPPIPADGEIPFMSTLTDPAGDGTLSRTSDTLVTWTPRAADEIAHFFFANAMDPTDTVVGCAVPACTGTFTIPSTITSMYAEGTIVFIVGSFLHMAPLPPTDRPVGASVMVGYRMVFGGVASN
jgi:hypothetical protein